MLYCVHRLYQQLQFICRQTDRQTDILHGFHVDGEEFAEHKTSSRYRDSET